MASDFEDYCWKDVIPQDVMDLYTSMRASLCRPVAGAGRHRSL